MTHVPHALGQEFPEHASVIGHLTHSDAHFARLAERYNDVNHTIYRIEAGLEPTADEVLENYKKQRLMLMDEIAGILARQTSK